MIVFISFVLTCLIFLLIKGELPLSQTGNIEKECLGVNIPEKIKYTQTKTYCNCLKNELNYKNERHAISTCIDKIVM
ncbi:hypothetical protein B9T27_10150 [Acinetobacter sp. ANC 4648]|nr:hypothetical protein B9T27_10150 [Acinetobacter sp. ANC 4648]